MRCLRIDLDQIIQISLLNKEHLIPPREHTARKVSTYILYLITKGTLYLEHNGKDLSLSEGDVFLFHKGDIQRPKKATDCEYYYIHFEVNGETLELSEDDYLNAIKNRNIQFRGSQKFSLDRYKHTWMLLPAKMHVGEKSSLEYFIEILQKSKIPPSPNTIEKNLELSFRLLTLLSRLEKICEGNFGKSGSKTSSALILAENITDYLEKNYLEDVGGSDIEKKFCITFDYANRLFRRVTGKSIIKHRNERRLEYAKHLLLYTEKSIEEIAYDSGFCDKYYFSRFFTKNVGVPPSRFRRTEREYI